MRFLPHASVTGTLLALMLMTATVSPSLTAPVLGGEAENGKRRALLLMMDDYSSGQEIPNVEADAKAISDVLEKRYRFDLERPEFTRFHGVRTQASAWVNRVKSGKDRPGQVVIYYRGYLHVSGGEAWLTEAGFDPTNVSDRQLYSVDDLVVSLSEIDGCPLSTLFLDVVCDTAPNEIKAALESTVTGQSVQGSPVAVYAAATRRTDPSWSAMKQSRMSFWLVDGLKGAALKPAAAADVPQPDVELRRLAAHTTDKLGDNATTVYARSPSTSRQAVVSPSRAKTLDELVADLAAQIATQLRDAKVKTVVIPEFVVHGGDDRKVPGEDYGPLLRYVTTQFKAQLSNRSAAFSIVDSVFVREILKEHRIDPENIHAGKMAVLRSELAEEITSPGVMAILIGELEHGGSDPMAADYRKGASVTLACNPSIPNYPGDGHRGLAMLNTSEWSMIGHSAVNQTVASRYVSAPKIPVSPVQKSRIDPPQKKPSSRRPTKIHSLLDYFEEEDIDRMRQEIAELQKDAQRPHPLNDPDFPWRIWLNVGDQKVDIDFADADRHAYSEIGINNTYTIGIENRSDKPVFLRLLVDGLNTLPDTPLLKKGSDDKFEVAVKDRAAENQPAQHVNLTNARAWYCEPRTEYEVRGFFTKIESEGKADDNAEARTFVVTDARSSEAARKGWIKDIGIVTAAFYVPKNRPVTMAAGASRGTKMGKAFTEKVETYTGNQVPGELLGVVHLRYGITREEEKSITNGQVALR